MPPSCLAASWFRWEFVSLDTKAHLRLVACHSGVFPAMAAWLPWCLSLVSLPTGKESTSLQCAATQAWLTALCQFCWTCWCWQTLVKWSSEPPGLSPCWAWSLYVGWGIYDVLVPCWLICWTEAWGPLLKVGMVHLPLSTSQSSASFSCLFPELIVVFSEREAQGETILCHLSGTEIPHHILKLWIYSCNKVLQSSI